jgi:hypothetical protein
MARRTTSRSIGAAIASSLIVFTPSPMHRGEFNAATSAIASLKAIAAAETLFAAACGHGGFAATFRTLALPPPGTSKPFLSESFTGETAQKLTYIFHLTAGAGARPGPVDCHGARTVTEYYAWAEPSARSSVGLAFAINRHNVVWEATGRKAPLEPFKPPSRPIQ